MGKIPLRVLVNGSVSLMVRLSLLVGLLSAMR
jgi:hypothetical protein